MMTERMPWTCRWIRFTPADQRPLWVQDWVAQWSCVRDPEERSVDGLDGCIDCERWEPRFDRVAPIRIRVNQGR